MRRILALLLLPLALGACRNVLPPRRAATPLPGAALANRRVVTQLFLEASSPAGGRELTLPQSGVRVRVEPRSVFTTWDLAHIELVPLELGRGVMFELLPEAARELARLSTEATGRRLVVVSGDRVLGARRLVAPILNGRFEMFLEVPEAELADVAAALNGQDAGDVARNERTETLPANHANTHK